MKMNNDTDDYYDLGSFHRPVTTTSNVTQTWFDRGLIWSFAFNHEESAVCFQKAITADPGCAMAYWGLAYALGPNYNKPWESFDGVELETTVERTHRAVVQAQKLMDKASPVERALINALGSRYPKEHPASDWPVWNLEYADAMNSVYSQFPDDLDVAALCVDALMNLTPWRLWDLNTGLPAPGARTIEAKKILDRALSQEAGDKHAGLLHLYIHLMEMSATPEMALPLADNLRGLVPDAGHLQHMPSHLDILCGDYRRAMISNADAIRADEKFAQRSGTMNFYTLYRSHDYHFRIYAAMFAGISQAALDTAAALERSIPEELLRVKSPPMADWLESFLAMRVHVFIRFGKWREIIKLELPTDQDLYCTTTAMTYYAKGVALAATGDIPGAEEQQRLFKAAIRKVPESRTLFNNKCTDILAVAEAMLAGELEYRKQNYEAAFQHLRESIFLDDTLPYDEPWGWMQPTRHAYGALLLEQGSVEEAAKVYAADLGFDTTAPRARQHPDNVWGLHGYHECLVKLGRTAEALVIEQRLRLAMAYADVPIKSSCYCRLTETTPSSCRRQSSL